MVDDYLRNPKLSGDSGKVINTDNFRPLFRDEGYVGSNAAVFQEPASYLSKKVYTKLLQQNPEKYVIGTGGGSGVGKSSALKNIGQYSESVKDAALVLDSNMSSYSSAVKKIKEANQYGKEFAEYYVYRDPLDSFSNGVVKRMKENLDEMGRIVPTKVVAQNHIDSWKVARRLEDEGATVYYVDNSLGMNNAKLVSRQELEAKVKYPSAEELTKKLNDYAKQLQKNGTITEEEYKRYVE